MKKLTGILTPLFLLALALFARGTEAAENPSAQFIQRTMRSLENSTAETPANVRVLFYGQSIVAQQWTGIVQKKLKEKYPTVHFTFLNRAIGGYQAEVLYRTAEQDLYPWYPDLLFFHVYGDMDRYEEIVRTVRERTTAEIILWSSHLSSRQDPAAMAENRDERTKRIREIAEKYDCMFIDLNLKWCRLLLDNGWPAQHLLGDTVHLKPEGCEYYADFIFKELVRIPDTCGTPASGKITTVSLDSPDVVKHADGSISLTFTGNRVCAVSNGKGTETASAELLLDGQPLSGQKELWANTRPSNGPRWMPAINAVGWNVPLVREDWTLTALPDSEKDGSRIHYRVTGSVTGEDGEGWSDQDFTSKSGRVTIQAKDYAVWQYRLFKMELPENYQVKWSSYPLFADPVKPAPAGERILLIQNCANAKHTLTIKPKDGDLGLESFVIHTPEN